MPIRRHVLEPSLVFSWMEFAAAGSSSDDAPDGVPFVAAGSSSAEDVPPEPPRRRGQGTGPLRASGLFWSWVISRSAAGVGGSSSSAAGASHSCGPLPGIVVVGLLLCRWVLRPLAEPEVNADANAWGSPPVPNELVFLTHNVVERYAFASPMPVPGEYHDYVVGAGPLAALAVLMADHVLRPANKTARRVLGSIVPSIAYFPSTADVGSLLHGPTQIVRGWRMTRAHRIGLMKGNAPSQGALDNFFRRV